MNAYDSTGAISCRIHPHQDFYHDIIYIYIPLPDDVAIEQQTRIMIQANILAMGAIDLHGPSQKGGTDLLRLTFLAPSFPLKGEASLTVVLDG